MKKTNLLWGLFFILAGLAVIAGKAGLFADVSAWNVIASLLLVPVFVTSLFHLNFWGMFFSLALTAILYSEPLGIEEFTPIPVLVTAAFLSIGFSLLFPYRYRITQKKWSGMIYGRPHVNNSSFDSEFVTINSKFSGTTNYVTSKTLKRADVICHYSGAEVYLDSADMAEGAAELVLDVVCSGVDIYIPSDWAVRVEAKPAGAFSQVGNVNAEKSGKMLVVKGRVRASGITINYV